MGSIERASSNGIYLHALPTCMNAGRVCIDWVNSVGCSVKIYKEYKGKLIDLTVLIERYDKTTRKVYFVGYEKGIRTSDLSKGEIGEIFAPTQPIAITHPDKVIYFSNREDARKYTIGSKKKVLLICPICEQTHEMRIQDFINNGFTCHNKNCPNSWNYKQSECKKGENHPMYGKKRPELSERMKGENNPMYGRTGENHPSWRGGITPIKDYLRVIIEPFIQAHKRSLNYTCELTGKKGIMNSHHIYPFINIVHDAHNKHNITIKPNVSDYTTEELKALEDYVLSYHVIDDYSNMILLAEDVHKQFHDEYGKGYDPNLTVEAAHKFIEEFKITWSNAE
jgi:hypothetical protein